MCITRYLSSFILPFIVVFSLSFQVQAFDSVGNKSHMFIFQEKLAVKGNDKAQYKIAFMYEVGEGVGQDINKAKEWYASAEKLGNSEAKNRLEFLQVKEKGFDEKINNAWLGRVKSAAFANESESLFLLGQLYQSGIGVKKDLDKALEIMYQLGGEGYLVADQQIAVIEKEQQIIKAKRKKANALAAYKKKQEAEWKKNVVATAVVASRVPVQAVPETDVTVSPEVHASILEKEKLAQEKAAKRARYEAVMRKLAEEQAEINRLQKAVQGDSVASVDEEF